MCELSSLVGMLLKEIIIGILLRVVLGLIAIFIFQVFRITHFNCSLSLSLHNTIVEDKSVLVLDLHLNHLLVN